MEVTAPHLTPRDADADPAQLQRHRRPRPALTRAGLLAGDVLRRAARTRPETLPARAGSPPPRPSSSPPACARPACAAACSPGTASSRTTPGWSPRSPAPPRRTAPTCAPAPASSRPPAPRSSCVTSSPARPRVRHRAAVVNAAGVWAGDLVEEVNLRPSRGTHLVLRAGEPARPPGVGLRAGARRDQPLRPGAAAARRHDLRRPHRRAHRGRDPRRPRALRARDRLPARRRLGRLRPSAAAQRRGRCVRRAAPPIDAGDGSTADLSRKHAVLTSRTGVVTIVGGKLTTYRQMAEDAVDAAPRASPG